MKSNWFYKFLEDVDGGVLLNNRVLLNLVDLYGILILEMLGILIFIINFDYSFNLM